MILSPKSVQSKTVASVSLENDKITVKFPERLDAFNEIVKNHGFRWQWPVWYRDVTGLALPARERCTELCYNLIDAGFIVDVPDGLVQDVIDSNFEPEQKHWIKRIVKGERKDWFCVCWPYGDSFYDQARRITGSEYHKPFVAVPKEHYAEVVDFAQIHGFKLTDAALELVELAKSQEDSILVVELKPRQRAIEQEDMDKIPDDLLDQD